VALDNLAGTARALRRWSRRQRLVARARAGFRRCLRQEDGEILGFGSDEIQVEVESQYLEFRSLAPQLVKPRVVTRLLLSVHGGEASLGTYSLSTDLDGAIVGDELIVTDPHRGSGDDPPAE
jgi:hypothetical protein